MVYLGYWQPNDFRRHASDGDGRKLYVDMTTLLPGNRCSLSSEETKRLEEDRDLIWSSVEERGDDEWGGMLYYAYKCRHCGKLRGYYDCD
jgi:hypothetical protein